MRLVFYFLTFIAITPGYAQDFCKHITKEESPDKKIVDYASPRDAQEVTTIRVTRNINLDPDYESDNFFLILQIEGDINSIYTTTSTGEQIEKDERKLIIEFEDKSTITEDTILISHDVTSDKMQAIRNLYYPITEENAKEFSTKKIVKFSLAGYEKTITPAYGNAIMHYVECVKKVK